MDLAIIKTLPVWFVAFLFSTICHEAAHALAGKWGGDDTAASQVTLDPTPHVKREPFGMIVVPLISFFMNGGGWMIGWASAPYDPLWASRYPKRAALMALAGPIANLILMVLAAVAIHVGMSMGAFAHPASLGFDHVVATVDQSVTWLTTLLSVMFSLNLLLLCFNLLPVPPLDGNGVVPLFLSESLARKWTNMWRGSTSAMFGLFIAWAVFGKFFSPIFVFAVNLLYPNANYG